METVSLLETDCALNTDRANFRVLSNPLRLDKPLRVTSPEDDLNVMTSFPQALERRIAS